METTNDKWTAKSVKNTRELAFWTTAWVLTMAVATFGPKLFWNFNISISILLIALNTIVGIVMILKNIQYLKGLDEMQRKLSLEAMSIALGVGVVGGLSYSMLDTANVITFNAEISHLVLLIGLTYVIGIVAGYLRYK